MPELQEVFRMTTQKIRPDEGFVERQQAYQRRRARNQKLGAMALVAALGVVAATAWVITTGGPAARTGTPVGDVPTGTTSPPTDAEGQGTTETGLPDTTGQWFVEGPEGFAPAPEGAITSGPSEGELVAQLYVGSPEASPAPNFVYVYDDGRVITHGWDEDLRWVGERRLTAEGVDLVRSGDIHPADLTPVSDAIPAELWVDAELKPFVPSAYGVCFWDDDGNLVDVGVEPGLFGQRNIFRLPAPAPGILRATATGDGCYLVTLEQARTLAANFSDFRIEGGEITPTLQMILPHGSRVTVCVPGGCG